MKIKSGQATVTTAGTRVQLGTTVINSDILIKANPDNTGNIFIGDSTVSSSNGYILSADSVLILANVDEISSIYVDASANGQKVSWLAINIK